MMTTAHATLKAAGVSPRLVDGRLKLVGPRERLTAQVIAFARRHIDGLKAELCGSAVNDAAEPAPRCALAPTATQMHPAVVAEIKRIEPEALRLGWLPERLWNRAFWPHTAEHPRGLASVMKSDYQVLEVSPDSICILRCRHAVLRFPRCDG
jgi:hypothetical protein